MRSAAGEVPERPRLGGLGSVCSDDGAESAASVVVQSHEMCRTAATVRTSESGNRHAATGCEKPVNQPAFPAVGQDRYRTALASGQVIHMPVPPPVRSKVTRHTGAKSARAMGVSAIGVCASRQERIAEAADRQAPRSDQEIQRVRAGGCGKIGRPGWRPAWRPEADE